MARAPDGVEVEECSTENDAFCRGTEENRGRHTGPKYKVSNHAVTGSAHARRDRVGIVAQRWPDSFEHDVHARRANVRVDTTTSVPPFKSLCCLCLSTSILVQPQVIQSRDNSPKVDQSKSKTRNDGKVRKVEPHRGAGSDGKGDMVARADGTVERDSEGDDDVSDSTCVQLVPSYHQDRQKAGERILTWHR